MTTVPLSFHGEILERLISFFENGRVFVTLGSRYMSVRYGRKRRKVMQSNEKNRRVEKKRVFICVSINDCLGVAC